MFREGLRIIPESLTRHFFNLQLFENQKLTNYEYQSYWEIAHHGR